MLIPTIPAVFALLGILFELFGDIFDVLPF